VCNCPGSLYLRKGALLLHYRSREGVGGDRRVPDEASSHHQTRLASHAAFETWYALKEAHRRFVICIRFRSNVLLACLSSESFAARKLDIEAWDPFLTESKAISKIMPAIHLLQLPAEIRIKILENLLLKSEPLTPSLVPCLQCADVVPQVAVYTHLFEHKTQKRTLGLYTEILRTCKKIHEEGTPLLYANTVVAKVWLERPIGRRSRRGSGKYQRLTIGLAQYGLQNQAESLNGLQPQLSNLQMTIKSDWSDDDEMDVFNEAFYDNIATLLRCTRQLKKLYLKFQMRVSRSDRDFERQTAHFELIQDRLRRVRGIPLVQVSGNAPEAFATQLAALMMEGDPAFR
jgi:hypothetical protein